MLENIYLGLRNLNDFFITNNVDYFWLELFTSNYIYIYICLIHFCNTILENIVSCVSSLFFQMKQNDK